MGVTAGCNRQDLVTSQVCGKDRLGEGRTEESKTTLKSALGAWWRWCPPRRQVA